MVVRGESVLHDKVGEWTERGMKGTEEDGVEAVGLSGREE